MNHFYIEVRRASESGALSLDIARHLPRRVCVGKVVIIVPQPKRFQAALRKRWFSLVRDTERQHSSTLNTARRKELMHQITLMRSAPFVLSASLNRADARVYMVAPDELPFVPGGCYTVYLGMPISAHQFGTILEQLPNQGLVVMYSPLTEAQLRVAMEVGQARNRPPDYPQFYKK